MAIAHDFATTRVPPQVTSGSIPEFIRSAVLVVRRRYREAIVRRTLDKLPAHLQHDIGEIDYRPSPPPSPDETIRARQTSLESMWLRYL